MLKLKSMILFIKKYATLFIKSLLSSLMIAAVFIFISGNSKFFLKENAASDYLSFYIISISVLTSSIIPWITNKKALGFLISTLCSFAILQITRMFYLVILVINQDAATIYYIIPVIYLLLIVFICISSIKYHRFGFARYPCKEFIKINDKEIIFSDKENKKNILLINELILVKIFSQPNDFPLDGMCWILSGNNQELCIYNDVEGTTELLAFLQQLPNFNNERFLDALSSTENNLFVVWEK